MGFSIALRGRGPSSFHLGQYLPLLAVFGLTHGLAEWLYIFLSPGMAARGRQTLQGAVLTGGHAALMALSFAFLLSFGLSLLASRWGWSKGWQRLPFLMAAVWLYVFLARCPADPGNFSAWLTSTEVMARYFLALPGAVTSSLGLFLQREEVKEVHYPPLDRGLVGASLAFALYAFAGGMVVPPAPFPPASLINTSLLLQWGLPVQLWRTAAAVLAAYFIIRTLDLYEIENRRRLEELRRRELVWLERERIRRDLHDGVIQSVYGFSLGLDHALALLKKEPEACGAQLRRLRDRADGLLNELRRYLQQLELAPGLPGRAVPILEDLLADFTASTGMEVNFHWRGRQEKDMDADQRSHFYHMASEILSNIRRHASATRVEVQLDLGSTGLGLAVADNGVGFRWEEAADSRGRGLFNLREQAAMAAGRLDIKSLPGKGTRVSVWLPYSAPGGDNGNGH
ncbi:MAG: hypothetical protein IMW96_02100 [Thermoanaerobacteraceae bacterium]|nr:hypothetical protein [Thermoanaerobacteraceae bacterium]